MDIDLLSKMVKELIPDHDRVCLPGFGCFVTEIVPSAFSDRGYTINPPYRRLSFRTGNSGGDTLLSDLYASSNGVEPEVAGKIISEFISEMKKILMARKTVVFPGLGRMRATRENNFFFVADEDLDIYPEGFGLEPVSLKSHQETREEVSAMISGLQSMIADGDVPSEEADVAGPSESIGPESVADEVDIDPDLDADEDRQTADTAVPEEPSAEMAEETGKPLTDNVVENIGESCPVSPGNVPDEVRKLSPWRIALIVTGCAIGLALLLLAVYLLAAHFCPDFIDSILYDSEQLDVLRYGQGRALARTCFIGF